MDYGRQLREMKDYLEEVKFFGLYLRLSIFTSHLLSQLYSLIEVIFIIMISLSLVIERGFSFLIVGFLIKSIKVIMIIYDEERNRFRILKSRLM